MPRLRNSVLANYAGQAWIALMGLAFVPLYLRELGPEGFGLVGFMLGLQSVSLLLDFGMGVFLNREIARRTHLDVQRASTRRLVRSFEWLIWPTACVIAITVWFGADAIATHWLNPRNLRHEDTIIAVRATGLAVALLWPSSFYANVLMGLERQPRLNLLAVVFNTLRYAGVVPVLHLTQSGALGFIVWYAFTALAQTACYAIVSWRLLPAATERPRFDVGELVNAKGFALGAFAVTGLALLLTQADRFILAALRPLEELGYYTVALTLIAGAGRLMQPMFGAIYPRMSRLVAAGDTATLMELHHLASQCLAVVAAVIACVSVAYAGDIVYLWTGDWALAERIGLPLTFLAIGTAANGLMTAPYALQLAHGKTGIAIKSNAVALIVGVPACIVAVGSYGMRGAASLWMVANLGYLVFAVPAMHRQVAADGGSGWYVRDIAPALAGAAAVVSAAFAIRPTLERTLLDALWLGGVSAVAMLLAGFLPSLTRRLLTRTFTR